VSLEVDKRDRRSGHSHNKEDFYNNPNPDAFPSETKRGEGVSAGVLYVRGPVLLVGDWLNLMNSLMMHGSQLYMV